MLNGGLLQENENKLISRLKERDVKHIKIGDVNELHEIYHFKDQIGQGGFATVICVNDKQIDKDWAMKVVCKSTVGAKLKLVRREIQILKMVTHPHIILLEKVYESPKKICLLLEKCDQELALVYKDKKPFLEVDTKKVVEQLASAVAYLHKYDIVHRDLKLENILLTNNPSDPKDELFIKVIDFGLSIIKAGNGYENMLHDCCGTLTYMSPEIITKKSYSQQCDVWAIGVIMYMLLVGHYPFYSVNEPELMTMICDKEPMYSEVKASPEAIHLLNKMLTKNPALRIAAVEILHHAWFIGQSVKHNTPENVLDMMKLWRDDMMVPVGAECDWLSTASTSSNMSNPTYLRSNFGAPESQKKQLLQSADKNTSEKQSRQVLTKTKRANTTFTRNPSRQQK